MFSLTLAFRYHRGNLGLRHSGWGFRKGAYNLGRPGHYSLVNRSVSNACRNNQRTDLLPTKCATHIQFHAVTLRPTGALGVIIVCLRSHAASRIVHAPLGEFANANLHLGVYSALAKWQCVTTCSRQHRQAKGLIIQLAKVTCDSSC
jgi:hypothetical protein